MNEINIQPHKCFCKVKDIIGNGENDNIIVIHPYPEMIEYFNGRPCCCKKDNIPIDACLAEEIQMLWDLGIITTGCCCGHQVRDPYIGVINEHIQKMKDLGYKVAFNSSRPKDEDSFIPKSIKK